MVDAQRMLKQLIWAAAQGSKQLALNGGAQQLVQQAATGPSAAAFAAALSRNAPNAWTQLPQRHAWRGYCAAEGAGAAAAGKHAAGAADTAASRASRILEHAAEAQMHKVLKAKGELPPENTPPSALTRMFGVVLDSAMLAAVGALAFAGYYTYAYPSTSELEAELADARRSLGDEVVPASSLLPPLPPTGTAQGALPPPPPLPASALLTGGNKPPAASAEPQPAPSFPPLTRAWCEAMERYLRLRKYVEKSIQDYRDPTYHKLLPDMAPELRGRCAQGVQLVAACACEVHLMQLVG